MFSRKPFSHKVVMSVLAFVLAAGGYGGYKVVENYGKYGADFENRLHVSGLLSGLLCITSPLAFIGTYMYIININAPASRKVRGSFCYMVQYLT